MAPGISTNEGVTSDGSRLGGQNENAALSVGDNIQ